MGERGFVAHGLEQLLGLGEWEFGAGVALGEQVAAVAEQGVGAFGDVAELVPAFGGVLIELGRLGVVAVGFGAVVAVGSRVGGGGPGVMAGATAWGGAAVGAAGGGGTESSSPPNSSWPSRRSSVAKILPSIPPS